MALLTNTLSTGEAETLVFINKGRYGLTHEL